MASHKHERTAQAIKEAVAAIISREVKDPRLGFVSVTKVDLAKDLSQAKIYISVYGNEEAKKNSFLALNSAKGFIKGELASRVKLRVIPELSFVEDLSIEYGARIMEILEGLKPKALDQKKDTGETEGES
ncbi:30S ribosome-binding factor RbfA [Carboxydothermus pertinax]|uniref:Ribosome-binding factor A n=1 Tax=Carboxydothermus pertinax TaxID=870242 RepID=A0A1L8CX46_9THEO|nr:30S ribosome-binding factor RbfA [Carboxydothermus pertinax]GAV23492.1 ribosome-binding factor A [Carboxydothermus pertinax]